MIPPFTVRRTVAIGSRSITRAVALAVAMLAPEVLHAQAPLFLVESPYDPPEFTSIYQVDPLTGEATLRASLGSEFTPILGLAAADGRTLYAAGTDNAGTVCPGSTFSCLLLRIVLDPSSTVPASVEIVGSFRTGAGPLAEITGMTFRNDGVLYVQSQATFGLYRVDTSTADAALVGIVDFQLYGGDLTFDADGRLLMWTNDLGSQAGLYEIDPETAAATLVDLEPGRRMSGLAALGHSNVLYGSSTFDDRLYTLDPVIGFTGVSVPITLGGTRFDLKRGDLDSPFCVDDASCDDGNPCTLDRCTAGGCRNLFEDATCDGIDDDCDGDFDEDYVAQPTTCGVGACSSSGSAACLVGVVTDSCAAGTPAADDSICNGIDDDCDGGVDEDFVPQYTTCGVGACGRSGSTSCVDGTTIDDCSAGSPASADATCDGIDDDCDGQIDEDADRDGDGVSDCTDNCPDMPNPAQADGDGDAIGDACDCAPADPLNLPPAEVGPSVRLAKAGSVLVSWDGAPSARYRVYRGSKSPAGAWAYNQDCLGSPVSDTIFADALVPAPGTVFYYYVARVGCGESILGRNSNGDPVPTGGGCSSAQ